MDVKRYFRGPLLWILLFGLLVALVMWGVNPGSSSEKVDTSKVIAAINNNQVRSALVVDKDQRIEITLKDGNKKQSASWVNGQGRELANLLQQKAQQGQLPGGYNVQVPKQNLFVSLLFSFLPIVIVVLIFLFIMNQMQGGGSRVMNFGKSKAKLITKDTPKTTFSDVAGAGEAGVTFYSISGSDFVEMFVGVGASRVRDLFEQAKANAPAIIFIDEIDAVGRHRGAGLGGGHDEREQTLNQLLVEMDGFDVKGGVILIAATNRPDILDPALLRPGRFDRQIPVDNPDMEGRKAILRVHAKGKPFTPDVDLDSVARRTPGFSGADLANVINEAALLTARHDKRAIGDEALEESIDRVVAGPQRRTRVM